MVKVLQKQNSCAIVDREPCEGSHPFKDGAQLPKTLPDNCNLFLFNLSSKPLFLKKVNLLKMHEANKSMIMRLRNIVETRLPEDLLK